LRINIAEYVTVDKDNQDRIDAFLFRIILIDDLNGIQLDGFE